MSQSAVEQILGRLLTDAEFRDSFFAGACDHVLQFYPLSQAERYSLVVSRPALTKARLENLAKGLEPSICRADLRPIEDHNYDHRYTKRDH